MMKTILIACFGLVMGCVTTSTGGFEVSVYEGQPDAAAVRADDQFFSKCFSVDTVGVRREPSGVASLQVQLRNRLREDVPIQYKFTFFDKDGMEVQPGVRAWEQKTIHGGESASLSSVAPEKSVVRFLVRVRRAM